MRHWSEPPDDSRTDSRQQKHCCKMTVHDQKRFNEEEKAQYFIGYLAAFPAKEETGGQKSSEQICVAQNEIGDGFQKQ